MIFSSAFLRLFSVWISIPALLILTWSCEDLQLNGTPEENTEEDNKSNEESPQQGDRDDALSQLSQTFIKEAGLYAEENGSGLTFSALAKFKGKGDALTASYAVGPSADGAALSPEHSMGIGDITNMLNAVVILRLQEENKLSIDDRVSQHLESFAADYSSLSSDGLTIKKLLRHESQLCDFVGPDFSEIQSRFASGDEEVLKKNQEKTFTPQDGLSLANNFEDEDFNGEGAEGPQYSEAELRKFREDSDELPSYSATNSLIIGLIIEKVTGLSYEAALMQYVIEPIKASGSMSFGEPKGYDKVAKGFFQEKAIITRTGIDSFLGAAGGMFSSVLDLVKLADALLVSKTLLTQESLNIMFDVTEDDDGDSFGYGLISFSDFYTNKDDNKGRKMSAFGYDGTTLGFSSMLVVVEGFGEAGDSLGHVIVSMVSNENDEDGDDEEREDEEGDDGEGDNEDEEGNDKRDQVGEGSNVDEEGKDKGDRSQEGDNVDEEGKDKGDRGQEGDNVDEEGKDKGDRYEEGDDVDEEGKDKGDRYEEGDDVDEEGKDKGDRDRVDDDIDIRTVSLHLAYRIFSLADGGSQKGEDKDSSDTEQTK